MYIGEKFEKNGKMYEVTSVYAGGYGFKEVKETKVEIPVFKDEEEEKPVVKRGRKKSS